MDKRNKANSHMGLEWGEQFAYEWYHVTESVMRNLERQRKPGKSGSERLYKREVKKWRNLTK